jgi:hypothetical protein
VSGAAAVCRWEADTPLVTNDILEARSAYALLEARALGAEQNIALLRARATQLAQVSQDAAAHSGVLSEYVAGQASANARLISDQAGQVAPDITLQDLISALGLSTALAEAAMPGQAIGGLQAKVQCFVSLQTAPDGVSRSVALRLYQPEIGAAGALATASFTIEKIPPLGGAPPPGALYGVLQDTQAIFSSPSWSRFLDPSGASPAAALVVRATQTLADSANWRMPDLEAQAVTMAALQTSLADLAASSLGGQALSAWRAAAVALGTLAAAPHAGAYSAGDLFTLTRALDTANARARAVTP